MQGFVTVKLRTSLDKSSVELGSVVDGWTTSPDEFDSVNASDDPITVFSELFPEVDTERAAAAVPEIEVRSTMAAMRSRSS